MDRIVPDAIHRHGAALCKEIGPRLSASRQCRPPGEIVGHYVNRDRRQTQGDPDPENRRMMDTSPVARRRFGFHSNMPSQQNSGGANFDQKSLDLAA
jgi:hypothetical protein